MTKREKLITQIWLIALFLAPIVLWILPAGFFDEGQSLCVSKLFFDYECLGCGMTRAIMHMHHFQFEDAIYFNMGSVVLYPALFGLWCMWVYQSSSKLGWIKK